MSVTLRHYELFDLIGAVGVTVQFSSAGPTVFVDQFTPTAAAPTASVFGAGGSCQQIFINEVDFNVTGEETAGPLEDINAVELAAPVGTNLRDFQLLLIDGDSNLVYGGGLIPFDVFFQDTAEDDGIGHLTFTFQPNPEGGLRNAAGQQRRRAADQPGRRDCAVSVLRHQPRTRLP